MSGWFSRLFRSRAEVMAERAEVEGRFEDAARLYVESGARAEAFRVLMRAAEAAKHLADRRTLVGRAYGIARTDELRKEAKKALGLVTLAEAEVSPPSSDEDKARLREAAVALESAGAMREAAKAYRMLGDREAVERALMLAGDVEGYEKEAGQEADAERYRLRRRNAVESFEAMWRSGDRARALDVMDQWLRGHVDDAEARLLCDERRAQLVDGGGFEARIDGVAHTVIGTFPVTLGREARVVLRGASVSREHSVIEREGEGGRLVVRDNGSKNGTLVEGIPIAGALALVNGQSIGLGADLVLKVQMPGPKDAVGPVILEVDRGMNRGHRVVLLLAPWKMALGVLRFEGGRAVLEPRGPVSLTGQRCVAAITLAKGDRVQGESGGELEVMR